jgi:hypothetical protein
MQQFFEEVLAERPYLVDLEKLVQEIGYGQVVVTLNVYRGHVIDFVTTTNKRKRYAHLIDRMKGAKNGKPK